MDKNSFVEKLSQIIEKYDLVRGKKSQRHYFIVEQIKYSKEQKKRRNSTQQRILCPN
jgi:uncharacterized protein YutD